jgi:GMP synthase-like glutamine amidotransferase
VIARVQENYFLARLAFYTALCDPVIMRIHILQHVQFEDEAAFGSWFSNHGHQITRTRLFLDEQLPGMDSFDLLLIMGGPMGVDDTDTCSWLDEESNFIKQAIDGGKYVIGVCLGAQLIARACGAAVKKNEYREIGWFEINVDETLMPDYLKGVFVPGMKVFHWHGDTFDTPDKAVRFAASEACLNQAFILNERVIALQFHIETTAASASRLVENCRDELDGSRYVQSEEEILAGIDSSDELGSAVDRLLERIVARAES